VSVDELDETLEAPGPPDTFDDDPEAVTPEAPDRYTLERVVGRGGQADVWVAWDHHLRRRVAFKQPHADAESERSRRRFLGEARIAARLEHPGIVPIHEIGRRADDSVYVTQKLIGDGDREPLTLGRAIAEAGGLRERLRLLPRFVDLCQACAYAHEQGILHRDLKPDNVVLGPFGETVLLDWGLALDLARGQPEPRAIAGTPSYMSPEQAKGAELDARSDVWALGAILFELLTGEPPFDGPAPHAVLVAVMTDPVDDAREREEAVPPELAAIVARALCRDLDARYASADDLAADVLAYLEGRQVAVYDYSPLELVRLFVSRHRALSAVSAASLVLLVAASVTIALSYRRSQEYLAEARSRLGLALVQKAQEAERRYQWDRAWAYYAAARVQEDTPVARWGARLAASRGRLELRHFDGHRGRVLDLEYSPDGSRLASASHDGTVRVWDHEGASVATLRGHEGVVQALAWSADGTQIVTGGEDGTVRLWDLSGGSRVLHDTGASVESVAFAPGGRTISSGAGDGVARLYDLEAGRVRHRWSSHRGPVYAIGYSPDGRLVATGEWSGHVRLFDPATGHLVGVLDGHSDAVLDLAFSPTAPLLATGSRDHTVRLWDVAAGRVAEVLEGHRQKVYSVAFSTDGATLVSGSTDQTVRLWQVPSGVPQIGASYGHEHDVRAVAISPDGATVAFAGSPRVWTRAIDAPGVARFSSEPALALVAHDGAILAPLNPWLRVVDARSGALRSRIRLGAMRAPSPVVGGRVAVPCARSELCLVELASHETQRHALEAPAYAAALAPPGDTIAVGLERGPVAVVDRATGETRVTVREHDDTVFAMAFTSDGATLVTGSYDRTLRVWDWPERRVRHVLRGHEHGVGALALSPDEALVASASWDETIRLWRLADGALVHTLTGHGDFVRSVAFTSDGAQLVSTSSDGTMRVWSTSDGAEIARFVTDEPSARAVCVVGGETPQIYYAGHALHRLPLAPLGEPEADLAEALETTALRMDGVDLVRAD